MRQDATREVDAVVLAGGESRRMGFPKAMLPWRGSYVLAAVVDRLVPHFRDVRVVGKRESALPPLPCEVLYDDHPLSGPLVGLATGLSASRARWSFVVGCDMPFLHLPLVREMAASLSDRDIAALEIEGWIQPLHAFYSRACLEEAETLLASGITSLRKLIQRRAVQLLDPEQLGHGDAAPRSLADLDTPGAYRAAIDAISER